jgi:hypothetical protein
MGLGLGSCLSPLVCFPSVKSDYSLSELTSGTGNLLTFHSCRLYVCNTGEWNQEPENHPEGGFQECLDAGQASGCRYIHTGTQLRNTEPPS